MDALRIGLIGTGSVVREIYQHLYFSSDYSHQLRITAAADPNPASLAGFCDAHGIPPDRRFTDYREMLAKVELDAVQVNTPDSLHAAPALAALAQGLDVVVPKPLSDTIKSAHAMIQAARAGGRLLGVDFHKRDDPRIREAAARVRAGAYGTFQAAVVYMLDKLLVADPNHEPRFFASPDFAAKNSPISFLTVHMADALLHIVGLRPVRVRASGWRQKLPTLQPVPVNGWDLCDTEIVFENGAAAHLLTGWHLPNSAHATTVQSARLIFSDGLLDLGLDTPGCREIVAGGIVERNPLFRNFEAGGRVSGYGISRPGDLFRRILAHRSGNLSAEQYQRYMDPLETGFWTTVVCEAAERSLRAAPLSATGAAAGDAVEVGELLRRELGAEAEAYLAPAASNH
ncbi:MAG: Gfo/Idh/MocA family oxidoreductase [Lentisphaeria bacterium]